MILDHSRLEHTLLLHSCVVNLVCSIGPRSEHDDQWTHGLMV